MGNAGTCVVDGTSSCNLQGASASAPETLRHVDAVPVSDEPALTEHIPELYAVDLSVDTHVAVGQSKPSFFENVFAEVNKRRQLLAGALEEELAYAFGDEYQENVPVGAVSLYPGLQQASGASEVTAGVINEQGRLAISLTRENTKETGVHVHTVTCLCDSSQGELAISHPSAGLDTEPIVFVGADSIAQSDGSSKMPATGVCSLKGDEGGTDTPQDHSSWPEDSKATDAPCVTLSLQATLDEQGPTGNCAVRQSVEELLVVVGSIGLNDEATVDEQEIWRECEREESAGALTILADVESGPPILTSVNGLDMAVGHAMEEERKTWQSIAHASLPLDRPVVVSSKSYATLDEQRFEGECEAPESIEESEVLADSGDTQPIVTSSFRRHATLDERRAHEEREAQHSIDGALDSVDSRGSRLLVVSFTGHATSDEEHLGSESEPLKPLVELGSLAHDTGRRPSTSSIGVQMMADAQNLEDECEIVQQSEESVEDIASEKMVCDADQQYGVETSCDVREETGDVGEQVTTKKIAAVIMHDEIVEGAHGLLGKFEGTIRLQEEMGEEKQSQANKRTVAVGHDTFVKEALGIPSKTDTSKMEKREEGEASAKWIAITAGKADETTTIKAEKFERNSADAQKSIAFTLHEKILEGALGILEKADSKATTEAKGKGKTKVLRDESVTRRKGSRALKEKKNSRGLEKKRERDESGSDGDVVIPGQNPIRTIKCSGTCGKLLTISLPGDGIKLDFPCPDCGFVNEFRERIHVRCPGPHKYKPCKKLLQVRPEATGVNTFECSFCSTPNEFLYLGPADMRIQYQVKYPNWWLARPDMGQNEFVMMGSKEVAAIQQLFDDTWKSITTRDRSFKKPPKFKVESVRQNCNPKLWQSYTLARRRLMQNKVTKQLHAAKATQSLEKYGCDSFGPLRSGVNELLLLHGTKLNAWQSICQTGFIIAAAGSSAGTLYGKGLYFAESCTKSDEYSSEAKSNTGVALLCRVTLGNVYYTDAVKPDPHALATMCGKNSTFNSCLGDREKARGTYREFIVYDSEQAYPEFVVFYRRERS